VEVGTRSSAEEEVCQGIAQTVEDVRTGNLVRRDMSQFGSSSGRRDLGCHPLAQSTVLQLPKHAQRPSLVVIVKKLAQ